MLLPRGRRCQPSFRRCGFCGDRTSQALRSRRLQLLLAGSTCLANAKNWENHPCARTCTCNIPTCVYASAVCARCCRCDQQVCGVTSHVDRQRHAQLTMVANGDTAGRVQNHFHEDAGPAANFEGGIKPRVDNGPASTALVERKCHSLQSSLPWQPCGCYSYPF